MKHVTRSTLLLTAGIAVAAFAQQPSAADKTGQDVQRKAWDRLKQVVGNWEGTGEGTPGTSRIERHYEMILHDKFILTRNTSVFAPQEKNKKGETHEDLGVYSFDSGRKKVVLRQFHGEGFVNQYVLEEVRDGGDTLVFTTESVENGPPGFRARLTITLSGDNELAEDFELGFPGRISGRA